LLAKLAKNSLILSFQRKNFTKGWKLTGQRGTILVKSVTLLIIYMRAKEKSSESNGNSEIIRNFATNMTIL